MASTTGNRRKNSNPVSVVEQMIFHGMATIQENYFWRIKGHLKSFEKTSNSGSWGHLYEA
jgi:hypothetical protein